MSVKMKELLPCNVPAIHHAFYSIGYSPLPGVIIRGSKIYPVALDGIGPNDAAYPIAQPIALCYRSENKERIQPLIDWLASEPGWAALHKIGVITSI